MSQQATISQQMTMDGRECAVHDCHAEGEHSVYGVPLCMVHWLRDRVHVNLARLANAEAAA